MTIDESKKTFENTVKRMVGLNYKKLGSKYNNRRGEFAKVLDIDKHDEIKSRLVSAIIITDVCMSLYQELFASFTNKTLQFKDEFVSEVSDYKELSGEVNANFSILMNELESRKENEINQDFIDSIERRTKLFHTVAEQRKGIVDFSLTTKSITLYLMSLNVEAIYISLIKLFDTTDLRLIGEAIVVALKGLAGINPIGSVSILFWDLYEVFKKKSEKYKQASDDLTQLDNYFDAAFQWCVICQAIIEVNEGRFGEQEDSASDIPFSKNEITKLNEIVSEKYSKQLSSFATESS